MTKEKRFLKHTIDINSEELLSVYKTIEDQNSILKQQVDEQTLILQQYKDAIDRVMVVSKSDTTGRITYVNDTFCKLSGYTEEELLGKQHNIIRHPSEPSSVFKEMWESITSKKSWHGEVQNRAKDGSSYFVDVHIFPLLNHEKEIIEYMAIRTDITNRVRIEQQVKKLSQYNQMLFDYQSNIIFTASKEKGMLQVNKSFLDTFGYHSLEDFKVEHECVCELFIEKEGYLHPSTEDKHWMDEMLLNPDKQHKVLLKDKKGEIRIYAVQFGHITFNDEDIIINSFSDITQIEYAREKAEESENIKASFMANMSHEIRTPMNGIMGFMNLLQKTNLDIKQHKYLELATTSMNNLLQITNNILDFSKIEAGQLDLDTTQINPHIEFQNSFSIFMARCREKNISYQIHIDSKIDECLILDKLRVTQVVNNLITNAIKFTPDNGTIILKIEQTQTSLEYETLLFSVSDSGIGIPKDKVYDIFKSFSQADISTTRKYGGTGLGLTISQSLCQLMNTKLQVDSIVDKGSTFYFELKAQKCLEYVKLSDKLPLNTVSICENASTIYTSVIEQLKCFNVLHTTKSFENLIVENKSQEILIIFDYKLYPALQHISENIILVDASIEAQEFTKVNSHIHFIHDYDECPSQLYNILISLDSVDSPTSVSQTETIDMSSLNIYSEDWVNRIGCKNLLHKDSIHFIIFSN